MDRRALLAVVLSLLVLVLYEQFLRHYYAPPPPVDSTKPTSEPEAPLSEQREKLAAGATIERADRTDVPPVHPPTPERIVTVDTPLYVARFSSYGARLVSFRLKRYRTTVEPGSPLLELIVPPTNGEDPFALQLRVPGASEPWRDVVVFYQPDKGDLVLDGRADTLVFTGQANGMRITKRYGFDPTNYTVRGEILIEDPLTDSGEVGLSWSRGSETKGARESVFTKVAFLQKRKLVEKQFSELEKGLVVEGDLGWLAFSGPYFLSALAVDEAEAPRLWLKLRRGEEIEQTVLVPMRARGTKLNVTAYLGPKDIDTLEAAGHQLGRAVDLGWFGFIAVPLLHVMQFSHRFTGNYGFDIILLTLLVKILFIPLTNSSFRSMRELQRLQPEMMRIREKYKDDPQQLNKEIMELYRRHRVNPLGGCLPMLLQLPVFIGLYSALTHAVELRHAPFILWINDLSAPDRLGSMPIPFVEPPGVPVLTLFMGASMFWQTWMTPSTGDPAQRQVMLIMPLLFTFMFMNFPSGLTLYWLLNNLLTIAQQYYMTRKAGT